MTNGLPGPLGLNDRLQILLKEYDSLHKEAEQKLSLMPEIGKSIGIVVAGALIGMKADLLGPGIGLCIPPIIMLALGAVAHTEGTLETVSRWLMEIEDNVFRMADKPLLTHETKMNIRRKDHGPTRWYLGAAAGTVIYLLAVWFVYREFHGVLRSPGWAVLYWALVVGAGAYGAFAGWRIGSHRHLIKPTKLSEALLESGFKTAEL